jgi:Right handed beta helix region
MFKRLIGFAKNQSTDNRRKKKIQTGLRMESLESREMFAVLLSSNFPSIQAALNAAAATPVADTVLISGGAFDTNLVINDASPLIVRGTLGANPTRIRGGAGTGITIQNSPNVTLQNLMVITSQRGMDVQNSGRITLSNLNISANNGIGLNVENGTELIVIGGQYRNNTADGMAISDVTTVRLTGPQVTGNGLDGVGIEEVTPGRVNLVKVLGGFYGSNGDEGLELEGATIDVTASVAHANREDGIKLIGGQNIVMTSIQATNNLDEGIDIDDITGSVRIANATVTGNGDAVNEDGLNARNVSSLTIIRGNFANNFSMGMDINDVDDLTINGPRVALNRENGLQVNRTTNVLLQGGAYSSNTRHGISIEGTELNPVASARLSLVQAANNGGNGIQFEFVNAVGIFTSLLQANRANGIKILNALTVQITSTNSLRNLQDGLEIVGGAGFGGPSTVVTMTAGSYSSNGVDGIDIQLVGPVTLTRTVGYSNADDGLEVFDSGTTTLVLTRFLLNGDDNVSLV